MNVTVESLIAHEISDFCAGLENIGAPVTPEEIKKELERRILPLVQSIEIFDATELVEAPIIATEKTWLYGEFPNEYEAQAWDDMLSGDLSKPGNEEPKVISCWSCKESLTLGQRAENDGFCPHCNNEIELDDA
ncbi:hypothetical protein [Rouxiella sp. S1S-2]|uniref:hypothetical protein n=1 Tax=Rouxiella sp. S1S-2 TaxID=2653856 RepID=UPI001D00DA43|nr:hypothetical protein [Rouxiella sp. S1S-2]